MAIAQGRTSDVNQQDKAALIGRSIQGERPFLGTFKRAFSEDLRQTDPNIDASLAPRALNTTRQLANVFVDEYYTSTGRLPTEQEIGQFLGESIDTGLAARSLSEGLDDNEIRLQIARPKIQETLTAQRNRDAALTQQSEFEKLARETATERQGLLSDLVKSQIEEGTRGINEQYGQERGRLLEEEAALGRLRQPASIGNIARVDEGRQRALSDLISRIRAGSLAQQSDITGQSLGAIQQAQQFGAQQGLQQQAQGLESKRLSEMVRQFNEQQRNERNRFNQELEASQRLGQLQAEASKPGTLDYINTAFQGLGAVGGLVGGMGGLGGLKGLLSKKTS